MKPGSAYPSSSWVWGAFKMPGAILHQLHVLWLKRERADEYIGTLVNAYLAEGGEAFSVPAGEVYVDVGTLNGYREAMRVLAKQNEIDWEQTEAKWHELRC